MLKLQTANAFQETQKGIKQNWILRENITNETLYEFNTPTISDKDMFAFLDFMRSAELDAFNIGIQFEKEEAKKREGTLANALEHIKELNQRIDYLQTELQKTQELL